MKTDKTKIAIIDAIGQYPEYKLKPINAGWTPEGFVSIHVKDKSIVVTVNTCEDNIKELQKDKDVTLLYYS